MLLPEREALCCDGVKVPLADCGVQKLEVLDWAWTVLRADLLSRVNLFSESGAWTTPPDYKTSTSNQKTGSTISHKSHTAKLNDTETVIY